MKQLHLMSEWPFNPRSMQLRLLFAVLTVPVQKLEVLSFGFD